MTYLYLYLGTLWLGFAVLYLTGGVAAQVRGHDYGWFAGTLRLVLFSIFSTASIVCFIAAGVI